MEKCQFLELDYFQHIKIFQGIINIDSISHTIIAHLNNHIEKLQASKATFELNKIKLPPQNYKKLILL